MDRFPKSIFITGCVVLGLTVAMGWGGITTMIKGQVKKVRELWLSFGLVWSSLAGGNSEETN